MVLGLPGRAASTCAFGTAQARNEATPAHFPLPLLRGTPTCQREMNKAAWAAATRAPRNGGPGAPLGEPAAERNTRLLDPSVAENRHERQKNRPDARPWNKQNTLLPDVKTIGNQAQKLQMLPLQDFASDAGRSEAGTGNKQRHGKRFAQWNQPFVAIDVPRNNRKEYPEKQGPTPREPCANPGRLKHQGEDTADQKRVEANLGMLIFEDLVVACPMKVSEQRTGDGCGRRNPKGPPPAG